MKIIQINPIVIHCTSLYVYFLMYHKPLNYAGIFSIFQSGFVSFSCFFFYLKVAILLNGKLIFPAKEYL